ncbi:NAD(+) diphosphatase [Pseudorhodoplanes sp.]|uniref:NAD(+) diphosphatase n=1 Tax=Pseudorhodoplanes sp. TaxID=1934341 RepID=UPI002BD23BB9|nr:NAD(+) diphosphatase [Pseudorhodoplanes sp.]HWV52143.1 NAD(+) diphosphatase [Pseudorhodoplanes sp.]
MQKALPFGPWPTLGYVDSQLDRAAVRRIDPQFLDACAAQETCGFYLVGGEMVVLKRSGDGFYPMFSAREISALAPAAERVFLGLVRDAGRFGVALPHDAIETLKADERFHVTDLRSIAVQGLVPSDHLAPLAEAKALLHWHARRHFCSNCGHPTEVVQAGWRRDCTHCKAQHFPRTDPVVIMLAVSGDRCLLGRQSRFAPGMWSCLAGFVEPGETIEEAARRETLEEAGIRCGRVRYFASQPWPFPSSLMIGCHAEATSHDIVVDYDELEDARWFSREEAATMLMRTHPEGLGTPPPVAIAHHIIRAWVEKGDGVFT